MIERPLGRPDRSWRASCEPLGDAARSGIELIPIDRQCGQAHPLGLDAGDLLVEKEMVFRLGEAAEDGPEQHGMVACGDTEADMAVEQARIPRDDRYIARSPAASPPPTATPCIAEETIGLSQLIML